MNLCAEYNKNDEPSLLGISRPTVTQRQRESDEENLREECSSTESTHQDIRTPYNLQNGDNMQVRASPTVQMFFFFFCSNTILIFILKYSLARTSWVGGSNPVTTLCV